MERYSSNYNMWENTFNVTQTYTKVGNKRTKTSFLFFFFKTIEQKQIFF